MAVASSWRRLTYLGYALVTLRVSRLSPMLASLSAGVLVLLVLAAGTSIVSAFYHNLGMISLSRATVAWWEADGKSLPFSESPVHTQATRLLATLSKAAGWNNGNARAYHNLGRVQWGLGDETGAVDNLVRSRNIDPENVVVRLDLANLYHLRGSSSEAVAEYEYVFRRLSYGGVPSQPSRAPNIVASSAQSNARIWAGTLGWTSLQVLMPRFEVWRGLREKYAADRIEVGRRYLGAGHYEDAAWQFRQAEGLAPYNLAVSYYLATAPDSTKATQGQHAALSGMGQFELGNADDFSTFLPEIVPNLLRSGTWHIGNAEDLISLLLWQRRYEAADALIERLLTLYPERPTLYYLAALVQERGGGLEQSISTLQQAIRVDKRYAPPYFELGRRKEMDRDLVAAASWYERYYELAPEDLLGLSKLASVYEELGREQDAGRIWGEVKARTEVGRIAAQMLRLSEAEFELGENQLANGGLEQGISWPEGWDWWSTGDAEYTLWESKERPLRGQLLPEFTPTTVLNIVFNRGLSFGGPDGVAALEGNRSARVKGLWAEHDRLRLLDEREAHLWGGDARAGWRSPVVRLEPRTLYLLALYYRTEGMDDKQARVLVSPDPEVFCCGDLGADFALPATKGSWRRWVLIGWNKKQEAVDLHLLIRNWGVGDLWFDGVELRKVAVRGQRVDDARAIALIR